MSAVETPIVTPIVAAPAPVTPVEAPAAPAAESAVEVAPIAGSTEDAPTATTAAVEKDAAAAPALKRSPFSDLKNKLFAPKSPPTPATHVDEAVKPIEETAAPVVGTPKENAAAVEPEVDAAPVTDAAAEEEKAKKVKGPSVVDRVKALFEKKEKAPVVAKSESTEDAAVVPTDVASLPPVLAAAPVVDETPAVETAPVAAAAIDAPVKETETNATPAVDAAPVDDASAVKFDEATKSEDKPKKEKDLVKLGRRLSARFGAALSPKKEKKDPLAAAPVVAGAPVVASEAPVLAPIAVEEVKVEEAKAGLTTAAVEEPVVPAPAVAAVEETKVEDVVATPAVESEAPQAIETSTDVKA